MVPVADGAVQVHRSTVPMPGLRGGFSLSPLCLCIFWPEALVPDSGERMRSDLRTLPEEERVEGLR